MKRLIGVWLGLLVMCGCTSGADLLGVDLIEAFDAVADRTSGAEVKEDLVVPDVVVDLTVKDVLVDTVEECEGQCLPNCGTGSCFGDPCFGAEDCESGICVDHLGDKVCSDFCVEDCPSGWQCLQINLGGSDSVFACVSPFPRLCRPCGDDIDCVSSEGQEHRCVRYPGEGSFCGVQCGGGKQCPDGYSCNEVLTVDGTAVAHCANDDGACPCTETSIALALSTPCKVTNASGTCTGQRVCIEEGLTPCDAKIPADETCDGLDNNCDGETDEQTCLDDNECTEDKCDPELGCVYSALSEGSCDDADNCTLNDVCTDGTCVGEAITCDDGNPCTDNVCDPFVGCKFPEVSKPCDDQNPCTFGDFCEAGNCNSGPELDCDDNNPCTTDACDSDSGCLHTSNVNACDDGNPCTQQESCVTGKCIAQEVTDCNDGNSCTDDWCDPANGCQNIANSASCNDNDLCTLGDVCENGQCKPGADLSCDDKNPCTTDSCNKLLGCVHANASDGCDDNDPCTLSDICVAGTCAGTGAMDCDDGNPCTTDFCDPMVGCTHTPNKAPCNDNNPCTTTDICNLGSCKGTIAADCDDSNPCTDDLCVADSGCIHAPNSQNCDDNNQCTTDDHCVNGTCLSNQAVACDDGNPCTKDICLPDGGCATEIISASCSDGDPCTMNDQCINGSCTPGNSLECNDNNPCTNDSCAGGECQFLPAEGDCDDGNACTIAETCILGQCKGIQAKDCDDDNICTSDSCAPDIGCIHNLNLAPCNDNDICTTVDACSNGECVGSQLLTCNDNNDCTNDVCVPATGCQFLPLTGLICSDGNTCTTGDACFNGSCVTTGFMNCEDGNPCTADICNPLLGCTNEPGDGPCSDGSVCTQDDTCLDGKCEPGPLVSCDDGNVCTDDSCHSDLGCQYSITDNDEDGHANVCDNCPELSNPDQTNTDGDSLGNACDNCIITTNQEQVDGDEDTVGDLCDNCLDKPNQDQADPDGDGVGTECDNCPDTSNADQLDSNGDGQGDACSSNCPGGLWIKVEGHEDICAMCSQGQYSCQAHEVCEKVTGHECVHQDYDCATGSLGSWYPLDGSGGSSNFNFAYAYDFHGGDYGNICACTESKMTEYGLAATHQYCGSGHWVRQ